MALDRAVLAVHRDAGEVADMLVRAGDLVEQRRFAAVLVADQRKGEGRAVRQRIAAAFRVIFAALAEARVGGDLLLAVRFRLLLFARGGHDLDLGRVGKPQRQLVPLNQKLHGISHRRVLYNADFRPGDHAHIKKVLAQRAFAVQPFDDHALSDFCVFQSCHSVFPFL